jgi:hypothetical protein
MRPSTLVLVIAMSCAAGCAKAPFTTSVLDSYGLSPADLGSVQFFTSEKIVLEREVSQQAHEEHGAELRLQNDTHTEVVEVSERIPCVVLRVEGDYLLLGFSSKDLRASLWFRAQPTDDVAENEGRYLFTALENTFDEREETFVPRFSKGFLISWSGQKYHVVSGRDAYLLYQMPDDQRRKVEVSAPGWRLSDRAARPPLPPQPSQRALGRASEDETTANEPEAEVAP